MESASEASGLCEGLCGVCVSVCGCMCVWVYVHVHMCECVKNVPVCMCACGSSVVLARTSVYTNVTGQKDYVCNFRGKGIGPPLALHI